MTCRWCAVSPTTSWSCSAAGVVELGPVRQVFETPRQPYTQALLAAALTPTRGAGHPARGTAAACGGAIGGKGPRPLHPQTANAAIWRTACGLGAFLHEMRVEKAVMFGTGLEVVRRQADRKGRNAGLQLRLHQAGDHRLRHEVMAIDAAIHHQRGGHDGVELAACAQLPGQQRHLERAGNVIGRDLGGNARCGHVGVEADQRLIDDIGMPAGLDEAIFRSWSCVEPPVSRTAPRR